jgi:hypothetical protein
MSKYEFKMTAIDNHIEKVGLDVRPTVEVRTDRVKLFDYANWLVEKWPAIFENIVQGPAHFMITKRFVFPGKGEMECPTLMLTERGPVYVFPRKLSALGGEETALPPASGDVVLTAMKRFKETWPQCKQIRLGKVNEYIFDCSVESAIDILAGRFMRMKIPDTGELMLQINRPTDDFNRIVHLETIAKQRIEPDGKVEVVGSGIVVNVDFNNRDMSQELTDERKLYILHEADKFCEEDLMDFLNGGT